MLVWLSRLVLLGLFLVGVSAPAMAQVTREALEEFIKGADEQRAALEAQGASEAQKAFFEGLVFKAKGQFPEAVAMFRRVLELEPENITARQELAHSLFLARNYRAARFHFEGLERADPNQNHRAVYQQFLRQIVQNEPWGISGFFSIVPSTNVNRGTTNTSINTTTFGTIPISQVSQEESGIGIKLGLSGFFRKVIDNTSRVNLDWNLSGTAYEDSQYNFAIATVGLSYDKLERWGSWKATPFVRHIWRDDDSDSTAVGLSLGARKRINPATVLVPDVSYEFIQYPLEDFRDGSITTGSLGIERQINPTLGISGGIGFEFARPDAIHLRYNGLRFFGGAGKTWKGGLQTSVNLEYGTRVFDGIQPFTSISREDDYTRVGFAVQHSRFTIVGFAPLVNCSHTINRSNVAFFDFAATDCQVALSKAF